MGVEDLSKLIRVGEQRISIKEEHAYKLLFIILTMPALQS